MRTAVDNDVLLKGACYDLLSEIEVTVAGGDPIGILGTAQYVIPKRIQRAELVGDRARIEDTFRQFVARHATLEPTSDEQELAASLEFAAQKLSLSLDTGESLLASITVLRSIPLLLTGDKRAITALEQLLNDEERLAPLRGTVACLEQLLLQMIKAGVPSDIRSKICAEAKVDLALSVCFSCNSRDLGSNNPGNSLMSYINDLRTTAAQILAT